MAIPFVLAAAALGGAGVVGVRKYLASKKGDLQDLSQTGPASPDGAAEPPDYWAFLSKWILTASEAPGGPAEASEGTISAGLKPRRRLTPTNATLLLLLLSVLVAVVSPFSVGDFLVTDSMLDCLKTVLFSATVGIGTNWIAIQLLFRPRNRVLGIQGIIPAKRKQIIEAIAQGIRRNLLDAETIRSAIHNSNIVSSGIDRLLEDYQGKLEIEEFRQDLSHLVLQSAKAFVTNPVFRKRVIAGLAEAAKKLPFQGLSVELPTLIEGAWEGFVERKINKNKAAIINYIDHRLNDEVGSFCDGLVALLQRLPGEVETKREVIEAYLTEKLCDYAGRFDIEGVLRDKLETMDEGEFHAMINEATDSELAAIQYLGALLGAAAGLVLYSIL